MGMDQKEKMVLSPYFQMLQAVIIEDTVIYPLTGSAFLVNIFILLGIPRYAGLEAQVAVVLYVKVHEVIIRTEWRQFPSGSTANEDGQGSTLVTYKVRLVLALVLL